MTIQGIYLQCLSNTRVLSVHKGENLLLNVEDKEFMHEMYFPGLPVLFLHPVSSHMRLGVKKWTLGRAGTDAR